MTQDPLNWLVAGIAAGLLAAVTRPKETDTVLKFFESTRLDKAVTDAMRARLGTSGASNDFLGPGGEPWLC